MEIIYAVSVDLYATRYPKGIYFILILTHIYVLKYKIYIIEEEAIFWAKKRRRGEQEAIFTFSENLLINHFFNTNLLINHWIGLKKTG